MGVRSRASSAGQSRDESWGEGGESSARFASPAPASIHHHQQRHRLSRTPTRSSASTTPRRSVQFARGGSAQPPTSFSSGTNWGSSVADVPRIQIRAKSPGEGWGGRDTRPKSPWARGGASTSRSSSSTRTPPSQHYSVQRKEGGENVQHQQHKLPTRSPRSFLTQSQQKQRVVPSVVLRCNSIILTHLQFSHALIHPPHSLDDTVTDEIMASSYSSARSPSSNHKVFRLPPVPPFLRFSLQRYPQNLLLSTYFSSASESLFCSRRCSQQL
jgi:hypothetical protein